MPPAMPPATLGRGRKVGGLFKLVGGEKMLGREIRRGFWARRGLDGGVGVFFLAGFFFWRGYGCHPMGILLVNGIEFLTHQGLLSRELLSLVYI